MSKYESLENLIDSISKTHSFDKTELIFLNTSDVLEGKILRKEYMKVSELKGQAKKTIKNGDILYSEIRPKNRRYAYVKDIKNTEDYVVSTKLMVLRNKSEKLDTDYLYHFLTYKGTINYLQGRAENRIGSFPQITFDVLKSLKIYFPQKKEQINISKVFSDLNKKIDLNNQINQELESLAKFIYDYWFVQFDFPDGNAKPYKSSGGKMVYNEVLKREIPEGWKDSTLSEIANITMGQSPPGSSYNEEGEGEVFYQGSTDFGDRFPTRRQYTTQPSRMAQKNEILLSVRAPVGTLNIANEDLCIGRGLAALNGKDDTTGYIMGIVQDLKQIYDRRNATGTTFGSITKDDLFDIVVVKPDSKYLAKYEKIVKPINKKILKNFQENQKLVELRDWLLPMLMNGQVKVK